MNTKEQNRFNLFTRLATLGFSFEESQALRRIELTLQRWAEGECGDSNNYASFHIERDDQTGKPYRVVMPHDRPPSKAIRTPIADREAGALKRLALIMANHPHLVAYHQSDPRGCMLYILRKSDLLSHDGQPLPINANYTRGVAVAS